jgi:hypothetical protein
LCDDKQWVHYNFCCQSFDTNFGNSFVWEKEELLCLYSMSILIVGGIALRIPQKKEVERSELFN